MQHINLDIMDTVKQNTVEGMGNEDKIISSEFGTLLLLE